MHNELPNPAQLRAMARPAPCPVGTRCERSKQGMRGCAAGECRRPEGEAALTVAAAPAPHSERIPCSRCTSEIWCEMHGCKRPAGVGEVPRG